MNQIESSKGYLFGTSFNTQKRYEISKLHARRLGWSIQVEDFPEVLFKKSSEHLNIPGDMQAIWNAESGEMTTILFHEKRQRWVALCRKVLVKKTLKNILTYPRVHIQQGAIYLWQKKIEL